MQQLGMPGFMASSGGVLTDFVPLLARAEQTATAAMDLNRMVEFAHGRMHARTALARLGMRDAVVRMASDRSPVWPPGFTGSISHVPADRAQGSCGQVIALVAGLSDFASVGLDLERTSALSPEHWESFLTPAEMAGIAVRPVAQRSTLVHAMWSAKEAVMKALRQALEPQDIEISLADDAHAFVAECRMAATDSAARSIRVQGRLANAQGWVAALATR